MAARSFIQQAAKQLLHFLPCFSGTSCSRKQEIWEHFSMLAHVWGEDVTEHSFMSSSRECVCWENLCKGIWGWKVEEDEFTLQRSLSLVFSRADFTPGELGVGIADPFSGAGFLGQGRASKLSLQHRAHAATAPPHPHQTHRGYLWAVCCCHLGDLGQEGMT